MAASQLTRAWQDRQQAVVLAGLYVSGATLVLVGLLVASWPDADRGALLSIVAAAYGAGVLLLVFVRQHPLPGWAAEGLVAAGGLLVSAGVYFAGAQGSSVIAVFYMYVSAYAFFYFPLSHAATHTALAAATYGLVLWQLQPPSVLAQWVIISGAAAVAGGVVGGLGSVSRSRYQTERATSEGLRTAGEVRAALLRAAGHDLRTPLAVIAGFTETLLRDELDDEQRRGILDRMRDNTDRIRSLLDDLLDLDRIEGGHKTLRAGDVALHRLVEGVAAASDVDDDRLVIDVEPALVPGDRVMLERVVDNLIGNAAKYSPPGSAITVRVRPTHDGAYLTVTDRGQGIPEHLRGRVFDPFVRGDHPGAGTGIGLYLVAQFVELHGGTVTFDAPEDGGARFRVDLPGRWVALTGSGSYPSPGAPS